MNPIGPHILIYIQLEQEILHNFTVGWEFIIPTITVLQLRIPGVTEPIICDEDRGKKRQPCFAYIPVCEVATLIKEKTNVFSAPSFAVRILKQTNKQNLLIGSHSTGQLQL